MKAIGGERVVKRAGPGRRGYIAYSLGSFALNVYWFSISQFLLFYYTDSVGLTPAVAGLVYMSASIWDGIIDPVLGAVADRTRTRWGGYRPYLLFGSPLLAGAFVLLYYRPPLSGMALVAFVFVTHILFRTCFAVVAIPFGALSARMTSDAGQRSKLAGCKLVFHAFAGAAVALSTQKIANTVGGTNGYAAAAAVFAVISVAIMPLVFFWTHERMPPASTESTPTKHLFWSSVLANRAFWTLTLGAACMIVCSTAFQKSLLYYFKYYIGSEAAAKTGLAVAAGSALVALPIWFQVSRRIGKRGVWFMGCGLCSAGLAAFWLIDVRTASVMYAFMVYLEFGLSGLVFSYWSMLPDCVEYGEWRTGIRAEAFIFGLAGLFGKVALGVGAGLFGLSLNLIGYHANQMQSVETLAGLKLVMVALPLLGLSIGATAMIFSPLKKGVHDRIVLSLAGV